jgi:hypothetical protein
MKPFLLAAFLFLLGTDAFAQQTGKDTTSEKEGIAVAEFGGAASGNLKGGAKSFGYSIAVEATPIENWLEVELGFSPTYSKYTTDKEIDFLIKKPWTLSPKAEFMFGVGLAWDHMKDNAITTNAVGGEIALDFMFWPAAKHRFGWYLEPAYEYGFGNGHEQSLSMSAGLLVSIP